MNAKKGFLRLTIVLSITAYIVAFLICLAFIPPDPTKIFDPSTAVLEEQKPSKDYFSEEILKQKGSGRIDWDKFDKECLMQSKQEKQEKIKIYNQAQRNLIFVPLISFTGVWSLWIVYFIVFWVVKGFKESPR